MEKRNVKPRILIVGDIMLDRYWFGEVNRISPEAPVPVVLIEKSEDRLEAQPMLPETYRHSGQDAVF